MLKKNQLIQYIDDIKEEFNGLKEKYKEDPIKLFDEYWTTRRSHEEKLNSADEWNDENGERWDYINPYYEDLEIFEEEIFQLVSQVAIKNLSKRDELRDFLYNQPFKRFDLIAKIGDDKSFELIEQAAEEEFSKEYYDASPNIVQGLLEIGKIHEYEQKVIDIFKISFDELYLRAVKQGELVNSVSMQAFAFGCANFGKKELIDPLLKAYNYCSSKYSHYELNKVTGPIALSLYALGYIGKTKFIEEFLDHFEDLYEGSDFVMDNLYALWSFNYDSDSALEFLEDYDKGLGKAVCALADLNAKSALPDIKKRMASVTDPITLEAFKEGIRRLETQSDVPTMENRMIWLYGQRSSTELVLGSETDNVFVLRARETMKNQELGEITESDESL